ncbi:DUF4267 domain-containing protein [Litorihabitans aurantiacus]|uniref:Membrane protein n=1 Tax=Litorihabitans aurantiacus TaxID=1930061 RepID=A0AA37XEL7_9MICO|nr:DUF4267 domain-containing protein [Litorihabitans aurantiacus]GMA31667.1 membrane protein [Litorihabitans aurantiacus]
MLTLGRIVLVLAGLAIAVIGALYLLRPAAVAPSFGFPPTTRQAEVVWLRVKGVRDLATGVAAAVLLLAAPPAVAGAVLLAFTLVPIGDAVLVLAHGGSRARAWGVHGATALGMAVGGVALLVGA